MEFKVIRTDEQYRSYLEQVMQLMSAATTSGTPESERLELLSVLIESYENSKYPIESPDPIDAIQFRMEEKNLKQADLVPYFGTRSRVSEVLGRKRPLTVQMIRALSVGLGISADTLVGLGQSEPVVDKEDVDWSSFPVSEMVKRGWIGRLRDSSKKAVEDSVKSFILEAGLQFGSAAFRRTVHGDAQSPSTRYALYAWLARIIQKSRASRSNLGRYTEETLSSEFLKRLAQMSWSARGPLMAVEYLEQHGISVVIEPHLNGTLLDGAALKDSNGTPIIALTLRFDRIDNFWFTLLHEVVHIWKHVGSDEAFLDDLNSSSEDRREAEANRLAAEAFIPRLLWRRSDAYLTQSREAINALAKDLRIHPAIIVGRLRKETGNYSLFPDLVGQNEVKTLFY
jgi:HTH-type transcriptional regulator / antitoxin HigA